MKPVVYFDVTELVKDLKTVSTLSTEQITENIFEDLGSRIQAAAQEKAPVKTGALRESIQYDAQGGTLTIEATVPYALFQEFGTAARGEFPKAPYIIRPKKAKYLVFDINGKQVRTKRVLHPGVPAHPYLRPAAMEVMGELLNKLADKGQAMILKGPNSTL